MRAIGCILALTWAIAGTTGDVRAEEPEAPPAEAAPAPGEALAHEAYLEARAAFERQSYDEALRLLKLAARRDEKPVYVYNMARVLETMGRNLEAYASFLRVRALPGVPESLDELAQAAIDRLEPLRSSAVVRFSGVEDGSLVQIDDELVVDLAQDHILEPGKHRVCVTSADGSRLSCWTRTLPEGLVTTWPPDGTGPTRGEIHLPGTPLTSITLDGRRMVVDLKRLKVIQVDVGTHELLAQPPGGPLYRHSLDVYPGAEVKVPSVGPLAFPEPKSVGPWPWIIAGTGLASLVTGGVLLGLAPKMRQVSADTVPGTGFAYTSEVTQTGHKERYDRAYKLDVAGRVLVPVGIAAVGAGVSWLLIEAYADDPEAVSAGLDVHIAPAPAGLYVGGSF